MKLADLSLCNSCFSMTKTIRNKCGKCKSEKLDKWKWPDAGRGELACPHGIGHGGTHGCDGCCSHETFQKAWDRPLKKGEFRKKV